MENRVHIHCPCCGGIIREKPPKQDPELHKYAFENNTKELCTLLSSGTNPNLLSEVDLGGALHRAAQNNSLECVEVLLAHGANVNLHDSLGKTPLHVAAEGSHCDLVMLLMKHGGRKCNGGCRKCTLYVRLATKKNKKKQEEQTNEPVDHGELELDKLDFMAELEKLRPLLGGKCVNKNGQVLSIQRTKI